MYVSRLLLFSSLSLILLAGCGGGSSAAGTGSSGSSNGGSTGPAAYTGPYVFTSTNTLVFGGRTNGALLKFRADSSGTVAPTSSITTASNGGFNGLGADSAGTLFSQVFDTRSAPILVTYSSSASGETAPGRSNLLGSILSADSIAFGPSGSLLLVDGTVGAQRYDVSSSSAATVVQSLPGVNTGAKMTTINQPLGIAQDASGSLYVADTQGIKVFASTATGDVAPLRNITGSNTTLVSNTNINPNSATIPNGLALNLTGEIYISTATFPLKSSTPSSNCNAGPNVLVFSAMADGNVAPIRSIAGDQTGLCRPSQIAFDKSGYLYVLDAFTDSTRGTYPRILRFAPGATGNVAPLNLFSSTAWVSGKTSFAIVN